MASNKNQHFVPRCYLRPFTLNADNLAINLFNLDRRRIVRNAPVKNQCAGDYFYGRDLQLENALQAIEGAYAEVLRLVLTPGYRLLDEHRQLLRRFWLLQHMRTEAASRRAVEMVAGATNVIASDAAAQFRMEMKEAVQVAMRTFVDAARTVDDLKVVLIRNRSSVPFLTSDDPAVLTNRWYFYVGRARGHGFGLGSAGAILLLPMSPTVLCVAYDGDVYSIQHENGWATLSRDSDAYAFNEHQFLNCWANVYFLEAADVEGAYARIEKLRPSSRHVMHVLLPVRNEGGAQRYRVAQLTDAKDADEALIHWQMVQPKPASWPTLLSWRSKGWVYNNGTALGYVRKSGTSVAGTEPFRREAAL